MPDVFIYSALPLGEARGDLEDDLEVLLGSAGQCTGGGAGELGWNIDLEIYDTEAVEQWIEQVVKYLCARPVPLDTYLVIWWSSERRSEMQVFGSHDPA